MATIPLKDITFPGLDNTYTIPEIDSTLSTAGKVADAKKTGDEIKNTFTDLLKAFPTDTASGAVASFVDGANVPVKSLVVNIDPVQSGSGDPSPSNVRPISGWSEVNVEKCGKNLFDAEGIVESIGHPDRCYISDGYLMYNTGSSTENGINWLGLKIPCPCVFHGTIKNFSTAGTNTIRFKFSFDDGTYESPTLVSDLAAEASSDFSVTIGTPGKTLVAIQNTWNDARPAGFLLSNTQLELGTIATPYEPYQSTPLTISLGQTVYGGTLDVVSGELTVDRAMVTLDGSQTVNNNGATTATSRFAYSPSNKAFGISNIISDRFYYTNAPGDNVGIMVGRANSSNVEFYLPVSVPQTIADGKAWFAENPTQLCYELATPTTVQLTPHEVRSLIGSNNVWADTGDTEVTYRADPTLYISKKITEAISALS